MRTYSHLNRCQRCRTSNPDGFSSGLSYWVKCKKCGKEISGPGDWETAILKWNNTRKGKRATKTDKNEK